MNHTTDRITLHICGAVQGVGFRPYVYRLATELALTGWITNDPQGVIIEVEGSKSQLTTFLERVSTELPPLASIHTLEARWLAPVGYTAFTIRQSQQQGSKTAMMLPDSATCPDCLDEIMTPNNRRYRYPFTNCTNCGPRFSIIQDLPYDRPATTMRQFTMCAACQREYDDPADRRFHAQPNACPDCGPYLWFENGDGEQQAVGDEALQLTVQALYNGAIVAVKGLGGFHLMVCSHNAAAVEQLRQRKHRPDKPLALMVRDISQAAMLCELDPLAEQTLQSPAAPILLVRRRPRASLGLANNIAPASNTLGIMLPYTPLHHLLLHHLDYPVVATSGNLSDEPICTDEAEARERLKGIADYFLMHNRPIERHVDDSIVWIVDGAVRVLRRARGYAPLPVMLPQEIPTMLAVGAHLKNTIALSLPPAPPAPDPIARRGGTSDCPPAPPAPAPIQGEGDSDSLLPLAGAGDGGCPKETSTPVFISQHIGDLETAQALMAFERVIADFLRMYATSPVAIVHDMHPDYLSTRWARQYGDQQQPVQQATPDTPPIGLIPVQHHHAHVAACMADNGYDGPVLGVVWDGTGYAPDGSVWGGEFLRGTRAATTRFAHLSPFRLLGGDAAAREPRRVALALLWEVYGEAALNMEQLAAIRSFSQTERRVLGQMLRDGVRSPLTTSAGRLFDGVAALLGLGGKKQVSFEGQAAMALEYAASQAPPTDSGTYPLPLVSPNAQHASPLVLDWYSMVEAIMYDLQQGVAPSIIALCFHHALVDAMLAVAQAAGEQYVALTGGCFQNRILTKQAAQQLRRAGFTILLHRQVPPNDGGICLGQIATAAAQMQEPQSYS